LKQENVLTSKVNEDEVRERERERERNLQYLTSSVLFSK
jgi:hypothetical protein